MDTAGRQRIENFAELLRLSLMTRAQCELMAIWQENNFLTNGNIEERSCTVETIVLKNVPFN